MTGGGYSKSQLRAMHAGSFKQPVGVRPVRLRLSRVRGANILLASLARNGLDVVVVARPSRFGNLSACTRPHGCRRAPCGCCPPADYCCIDKFREFVASGLEKRSSYGGTLNVMLDAAAGYPYRTRLVEALPGLRGKNLACWCPLDQPCHADVLLELANG